LATALNSPRFEFGVNWCRFLADLDDERIAAAERSLCEMLGVERLEGRTFLDIGSGSGLFSLAARRLGATVHSFDYDAQSVACTLELRSRYRPGDAGWVVERGSVLDPDYMKGLGSFDFVYSWGVLHHTGAMWLALEHALGRVEPSGGRLFIAIYADQGWKSHAWWFVKRAYNRLPRFLRPVFVALTSAIARILAIVKHTLKGRPMAAIAPLFKPRRARGMSARHDRVDWIGGFPYEFATLETLVAHLEARGFVIQATRSASSHGCHEIVARRA
jgi:2-polyprenyl-6-hydroxyphenyl methylase/3-demethylubiquinone-9 3-methyltransferase